MANLEINFWIKDILLEKIEEQKAHFEKFGTTDPEVTKIMLGDLEHTKNLLNDLDRRYS